MKVIIRMRGLVMDALFCIVQAYDARTIRDIASALGLISGRAAEKKMDIVYAHGNSLPSTISAELMRLWQILFNVPSNAVKFTGAGDTVMTVAAAWPATGWTALEVSLHDTEIGLNE